MKDNSSRGRKCKKCSSWQEVDSNGIVGSEKAGQCRVLSPRVTQLGSCWPITPEDGWCAQYNWDYKEEAKEIIS